MSVSPPVKEGATPFRAGAAVSNPAFSVRRDRRGLGSRRPPSLIAHVGWQASSSMWASTPRSPSSKPLIEPVLYSSSRACRGRSFSTKRCRTSHVLPHAM